MSALPLLHTLERPFKASLLALLRFLLASRAHPLDSSLSFRNILVIRQHNQLGDMLCVVPLLRALRVRYPDAAISLLASPGNRNVMIGSKFLREVLVYDKTEFLSRGRLHGVRLWRFVRSLRSRHFDLAIVPSTVSTSFTSDMLAYLSGARVRVGAGILNGVENPSRLFFTVERHLTWPADRHQTLRNLDMAGNIVAVPDDLSSEITLQDEEREEGRRFVLALTDGSRPAVALHPGAGKPQNRWPAERFAEVADRLAKEFNAALIVSIGPMDSEAVAELEGSLHTPSYRIDRQSIRYAASVFTWVDLVLSNDTGVMHVAAAVGSPVLSLFGPTDARQWAPPGEKNRYIQGVGRDIRTISVAEVTAVAREMLASSLVHKHRGKRME